MKENKSYDISLIFPPLILDDSCPPAGIPSIAGYLKTYGYNPKVLDIDYLYKKSFLMQMILSYIQNYTLSLIKKNIFLRPNVNIQDAKYNTMKRFNRCLNLEKLIIRKVLLYIYRIVIALRIYSLDRKTLPLENMLMASKKNYAFGKIEKRLKSILQRTIKDEKILGISVVYPNQILYALIISRLIKEINKEIFIVLGGSQITMHIHKFATNAKLVDYIDGFIIHEGEEGLRALLDGKKFDHIPNLYYRVKDSYKHSECIDFSMSVMEYKCPDFSGFNLRNYSSLPIRTLRGCYWGKCAFCSYPYTSGRFDMASAEFVVENIMKLKKNYNFCNFEFIDSSLPSNFLQNIAKEILKNGLNINWYCRVNCENAFKDSEFIALLKQSGCERLAFGLESSNERILQLMNKQQKDKKMVIEIIKTVKSQGITPFIYIMFGFPSETRKEMKETLDFAMMLKIKFQVELSFSIFNLLEHSYIYDYPHDFKIKEIFRENLTAYQGYGHRFECAEGASRKEVYDFSKKANLFRLFPFLYRIL